MPSRAAHPLQCRQPVLATSNARLVAQVAVTAPLHCCMGVLVQLEASFVSCAAKLQHPFHKYVPETTSAVHFCRSPQPVSKRNIALAENVQAQMRRILVKSDGSSKSIISAVTPM